MHGFGRVGAAPLALWALHWLGVNVVSGVVHLLALAAVICVVLGLVKKGERAVGTRL
jgi:hypothetical protein